MSKEPNDKQEVPPEIRPMFDIAEKMGAEAFKAAVDEGIRSAEAKGVDTLMDGTEIMIDFDHATKELHPAIDIVNDKAFIGVLLPCLVTKKSKDEDKFPITESKDLPFLITSGREKILMNEDELRKRGYRLIHAPAILRNKWSERSIKEYLMGYADKPEMAKIYRAMRAQWTKHMELDKDALYDFFTLFCFSTYFFIIFPAMPYPYLGGIMGVGKTKALTIASQLCFNAIFSSNISSSALFRLVEAGRCTVLIDEGERLRGSDRGQDLLNITLAGYKRGGKVWRTERTAKDQFITVGYEVYGPKMIANIGGLDAVLADRCIPTIIRRGLNKDILNADPNSEDPIWQSLRDTLHILFLVKHQEVKEIYDTFDASSVGSEGSEAPQHKEDILNSLSLGGRDRELWLPFLVLARFFDKYLEEKPTLEEKMLGLLKDFLSEKSIDTMLNSADFLLVKELQEQIKEDGYYPVKDITGWLTANYNKVPDWLNSTFVGRSLYRLGLREKRRVGRGVEYRITPNMTKDLVLRLKIPGESKEEESKQPPISRSTSQPTQPTQPTQKESCLSCGLWQGSEHTEQALCSERHDSTPQMSTCEKWRPKHRPEAS